MITEIKKYLELKFKYELSEITIKQRGTKNPKIYSGPGLLAQNEDGELILKMYSKSSESPQDFLKNDTPAGKIIDKTKYYDVRAVDMYGYIWKSEKVRVRKHYGGGGKFLIIYANLYQILCKRNLSQIEVNSSLILYFNKNLKLPVVPYLETQEIKEKEPYKNVRVFSALNVRDFQIIIFERTNWIEVNIYSTESKLPKNIDLRVCEALQFITNTKLNWFYYEKFDKGENYRKLNNFRSYNIIEGPGSPIEFDLSTSELNWELFKLYLNYILDYSVLNKYHTISGLINLIIQAEKLPIEVRFQTICVCVESILNSEFQIKIDIDSKLQKHQTNILKFIDETVDEEFKDRLRGLLAQLSNTRPEDKLYKLAKDGLIEENLIKEWKSLRNPTMHGERIQADKLQEYLDKYYSTLTLFYQLIFLKIGYTGMFTDYSSINWPTREFKSTIIDFNVYRS